MSVADILDERRAFSFEVFPPKTDAGMEKLIGEGGVLEHLYELNPDYISCTYSAGGGNVARTWKCWMQSRLPARPLPLPTSPALAIPRKVSKSS